MSGPLLTLTMLNNIVAGRMTGAQLEATLADPTDGSALGGFLYLMQQRAPVKQITISALAMATVTTSPLARDSFFSTEYRVGRGLNTLAVAGGAASSTTLIGLASMNAIAANSTGLAAIIASPAVLAATIASPPAFAVLLASSSAMSTIAASATAMTVVAASATAMNALAGSVTATAAVVSSSTAMTAIFASATAVPIVLGSPAMLAAVAASPIASTALWASNSAADAVLTSTSGKLAIYNSDTALAALQATPVQVQRQIDTAGRCTTSDAPGGVAVLANGTRTILLRRWYSGSDPDTIDWARGSTTAAVGQGPTGGGRNLDTGVTALGAVSGSYTSTGAAPTANTDTANFVAAANGLMRRIATGKTLTLIHIPVGA